MISAFVLPPAVRLSTNQFGRGARRCDPVQSRGGSETLTAPATFAQGPTCSPRPGRIVPRCSPILPKLSGHMVFDLNRGLLVARHAGVRNAGPPVPR